jgi:xylulokinase
VIGGGARSAIWNRIKADVLNVAYRRVSRSESATWGSALIAGKSVGLIGDLAAAALEAAPLCPETVTPDSHLRGSYDDGLERYLRWQRTLQDGFEHAHA